MKKEMVKGDNYPLEKWCKIVEACQSSKSNVKQYCDTIGITSSTYYYYLKKVQNRIEKEPTLVPISFVEPEKSPSVVNINYHDATIQIMANDTIALCAVMSALKNV